MGDAANSPQQTPAPAPPEPANPAPPGSAATATRPAPVKPKPKILPPWKVLLHNDDVNSFEEVIDTIRMLTPLSKQDAELRTMEAHLQGVALLLTTHKERAELYVQQFASRHLTVTIEAAE